MESSLFKIIFGHNFCICQLIFKVFAVHFTTNLDLTIGKKIFCFLRSQKQHAIALIQLSLVIMKSALGHPRSLISTPFVHCLDIIISILARSKIFRLKLIAEQACLSLTWSHNQKAGFPHDMGSVELYITDDEDGEMQTQLEGEDTRKCLLCLKYGDQDSNVSRTDFTVKIQTGHRKICCNRPKNNMALP